MERTFNDRQLVFDMDGTIFDLYGVKNWLARLRDEDETPYLEAAPMRDMAQLTSLLWELKRKRWRISINSWLSMESSKEYKQKVRAAKRESLLYYFGDIRLFDEIHLIQYGTRKIKPMRFKGGVLIDDNDLVRAQWEKAGGKSFNPVGGDVIEYLKKVLEERK